ncbi:hypothetical protein [Candidatus Synechococcus spongiarum]|uniref:Uncharacterized protein n=1 Tax=Candidatus Synechococcus spongiarum TaxID=431041 RepID=A0A171DG38_9SYNE|nr:hypothetical protein [Candidatus Synechococcus spongiarum]SAY38662.1 hypothetical protein FLM9_563 [Candidatus Synechococcus spongiarum]
MRWRTLWFPWIGLALTTVLLLKLLAIVVGSPQGEDSGMLLSTLAFTVHDHGPMALLGLLVAAMGLQANTGSLPSKAMTTAQRLTWQLTAALAVLLAALFLGSTILGEVELQQSFAQQQAAIEQEVVQLQEELERIQSPTFLDALAEPGRLEDLQAGLPDLAPDADAEEAVAALEQVVLQDLNELQHVQESHAQQETREVWGARLFSQLPETVLGVGAAVVAGVALSGLAGAENKKTPTKDNQSTD